MSKIDLMHDLSDTKPVLGGFVRLVDCMPRYCEEGQTADHAVCRSARVSYDGHNETGRSANAERGLIRYLMRHRHTSPFEMVEFTFHVKVPIFIARQWMRHRTGSFNEISARYSVIGEDFHLPSPDEMGVQATDNKQGRDESGLSHGQAVSMLFAMESSMVQSQAQYERLLGQGLARELARTILPVATYTEFYWKVDMLNLLKFLHLRMDKHAQYEIRVYAQSIAQIVERIAPWSYEAFTDYWVDAPSLSSGMWTAVCRTISHSDRKAMVDVFKSSEPSKREVAEFAQMLGLNGDGAEDA
jgi:thymidylate synthase (FAD)